jgi:hypothetical protein
LARVHRTNPTLFPHWRFFNVGSHWNGLFLAVGYAAKTLAVTENASVLALEVMLLLVVGEGLAFLFWRWWHRVYLRTDRSR